MPQVTLVLAGAAVSSPTGGTVGTHMDMGFKELDSPARAGSQKTSEGTVHICHRDHHGIRMASGGRSSFERLLFGRCQPCPHSDGGIKEGRGIKDSVGQG